MFGVVLDFVYDVGVGVNCFDLVVKFLLEGVVVNFVWYVELLVVDVEVYLVFGYV